MALILWPGAVSVWPFCVRVCVCLWRYQCFSYNPQSKQSFRVRVTGSCPWGIWTPGPIGPVSSGSACRSSPTRQPKAWGEMRDNPGFLTQCGELMRLTFHVYHTPVRMYRRINMFNDLVCRLWLSHTLSKVRTKRITRLWKRFRLGVFWENTKSECFTRDNISL